jgi:hypothetical protein
MPAKVTGTSASAKVVSLKLRAGVSTVAPIVGTTKVYPVADISYILLAINAYLDTTGLFNYTADILNISDVSSLNIAKIADADAFTVPDNQTYSTDKALTDTTTINDSLVAVLIFIRDITETINLADTSPLLISPAYFETVTATDLNTLSIDKAFADSFALNDLTDTAGPLISFSDYTNNAVSTADDFALLNTKTFSESLSLADSGIVTKQDYCDITYFAEDYVGVSITF